MKTFSQLLKELNEALGIYTNLNAFTPLGSDMETPKERKFRLAWERRAKASGSAAVYNKELKRLQRIWQLRKVAISKRKPFPWLTNDAGWWHPKHQWFTFNHTYDGYHVTQIARHPQRFGISETELFKACQEYVTNRDTPGERVTITDKERDTQAARILSWLKEEKLDLCFPVQRLAYARGWLKVYGGKYTSAEGIDQYSFKGMVREAETVIGDDLGRKIDNIELIMIDPANKDGHGLFKRLNSKEAIQRFLGT